MFRCLVNRCAPPYAIRALSQNPAAPMAGQVSADGQFRWDGSQWVPIPRGTREPTPWTRPMQMAVAAYFVLTTMFSVLSTLIFINHDSLLKVMQAQGNLPQGTDIGQVVNIALQLTLRIGRVLFPWLAELHATKDTQAIASTFLAKRFAAIQESKL